MSVLIKGMKMPKSCSECRMLEGDRDGGLCHAAERWLDDEEYWRWFTYEEGDIDDSMPSNCPLIELPDHGDLIDKTDLMASLADWQLSEAPEEGQNWWLGKDVTSHELQYSIYRLLGDVYEEVRDEPVVIPAERSEE